MHTVLKGERGNVIYVDNAATTRISDHALEKMLPFLRESYGNASSLHSIGARAKRAIEEARRQTASAIGAAPTEIIFTSGGSEANSWVMRGVAEWFRGESVHIVTTSIEHPSILNACQALEASGVGVSYLPVSDQGVVDVETVASAICPNTKLVSVMLANNEVGTLQPIADIGRRLQGRDVFFHTDAVQALGHIPVDVSALHVDFLTASAHKFHGPKGCGFLFSRSASPLPQLVFGGRQEHGQRAGTENVAGVVALGAALEESIAGMGEARAKLISLAEATAHGLRAAIPGVEIQCEAVSRLPGMLSVTFPHVSGEAMLHLLDLWGICVSTGSACNSGKDKPSHVLLALGITEEQAKSSIRISYGRYNLEEDAEKVVAGISRAFFKIADAR